MAISLAFYKLFILLKIPSALDSIFIQQALIILVMIYDLRIFSIWLGAIGH